MYSKIFGACSLGAVIGAVVALQVAPQVWWVGLIIGAFVGYLSYDFKEVRSAAPEAWRAVMGQAREVRANFLGLIKQWLTKPHPIAHTAAVLTLPYYWIWIAPTIMQEMALREHPEWWVADKVAAYVFPYMFAAMFYGVFTAATSWILVIFAKMGSFIGENCYWYPFMVNHEYEWPQMAEELEKQGFHRGEWTYRNFWRWTAKGVLLFVPVILYGVFMIVRGCYRFLRTLFVLIHSEIRLLCACDAAIGAAAGYFYGNPLIGGVVGGIFGVLNYEVVSKRLLRIRVPR